MNVLKIINERIYLILLISAGLGLIIFIIVIFPMMQSVKGLKRQEILISSNVQLLSGLKNKNTKDQIAPKLIAQNEVPKVIEELTALGAANSVTFLSFVHQDRKRSEYKKITTLPLELETRSTYKQLGVFMGQINGLKQGIVLIDKFEVHSDENEPDKVNSKIHLYICLKKEGHAKK